MRLVKSLYKLILYTFILVIVFLIVCNVWIINVTKGKIYSSVDKVPYNEIALVLGTSKRLVSGESNPFFDDRITAAEKLYKSGKVKHLILSGDNQTKYYNEPQYMKDALLKKGIPDSVITLDYAGLRTLDSVVRCKDVFGQNKFTIITQKFHSYRAVFISQYYNIDATAFSARDLPITQSFKVVIRELLARPKAILDVYFLDTNPKYSGERVVIEV